MTAATSDLNSEILAAIGQVQDADSRVMLSLLARVHADISSRLDRILADERRIKDIVLNGHTEVHSEDHVWLAKYRPLLEAAVEFDRHRAQLGGYCDFAHRQIEAEKAEKASKRNIRDTWVADMLKLATVFALGVLTNHFFGA
jgi:hypothetical protein